MRLKTIILLAGVTVISFVISCAPTNEIPLATTESRPAPTDDGLVRELKTLTEDIRQQIRAYQQISEDYESVLSHLRGLARHQQFKAVSTLLGTAFRADDHTTRLENIRALGSKMSPDERKLASEILKWGQEVRAVGARFDALDKTQNDLRRRGLDVGVRVAVSLADDLPRTQRVYYLALSKVLEGEIENLTTTVKEVNQQLNNMGANP